MEKFPGTPAGVDLLGAAINGKLTEIHLKHRKVAVGGDADTDGKIDMSTESLDEGSCKFLLQTFSRFQSATYTA